MRMRELGTGARFPVEPFAELRINEYTLAARPDFCTLQEIPHAGVSVGQTFGAAQRCAILDSARELAIRE
jgi:hypothetical protein